VHHALPVLIPSFFTLIYTTLNCTGGQSDGLNKVFGLKKKALAVPKFNIAIKDNYFLAPFWHTIFELVCAYDEHATTTCWEI
jgi:hypothetical protein